MNFLIIDDDEYKVNNLTKYFHKDDSYTIKKSYNSGLRELINNKNNIYDCIILDMNFPIFDNEQVEVNTGLDVLCELERKIINIPIVIYSSATVDVSKYKNIIEYILYDNYNFTNKINSIRNILLK